MALWPDLFLPLLNSAQQSSASRWDLPLQTFLIPKISDRLLLFPNFKMFLQSSSFLAINGHHLFLQTAVLSYKLLPPGQLDLSGRTVPFLMELASHMFTIGVQFSAPVLAVLLLSGLILGVLARVFPQLNVFLLSFPINIGTAFIVIALTLPMVSILIRREFDMLGEHFLMILKFLNP